MVDPQVIAFTGIAALLTITPGADTMMILGSVFARGQKAGMLAMIGICSGLFFHANWKAFFEGTPTNLLNPRVAIFYLAFLIFSLGRMRGLLIRPRVKQRLETLEGAVLIAFAVRLITKP